MHMGRKQTEVREGPVAFVDRPRRRSLDMVELGIPEFVRVSYIRTQSKILQPDEHVHTGLWEIVFIRHGRATYVTDGKEVPVSANDVIVNRPGSRHCIRGFPAGLEFYAMMFAWPRGRKRYFGEDPSVVALLGRGLEKMPSLVRADSRRLTFLFRLFFETHDVLAGVARTQRLRTILLLILQEIVLMPQVLSREEREPSRCVRIAALIEEIRRNPEREYQLGNAAERVFLSVQQFTNQFRQMTGCTLHQYLLRRRVEVAKPRLRKGETLSAVARATGFSSARLLADAFRRIVGRTVGEWREELKRNRNKE